MVRMMRKGLWSPEEDEKLRLSIAKYVNGSWNDIAKKAGLERCGRSCRQRWLNHLRPGLKKEKFSREEVRQVMELQSKLGNRWSEIAAQMRGRTDNEVKNLWNTVIKRRLLFSADNHRYPYNTANVEAAYVDHLVTTPLPEPEPFYYPNSPSLTLSNQSASSSHDNNTFWSLHVRPGCADLEADQQLSLIEDLCGLQNYQSEEHAVNQMSGSDLFAMDGCDAFDKEGLLSEPTTMLPAMATSLKLKSQLEPDLGFLGKLVPSDKNLPSMSSTNILENGSTIDHSILPSNGLEKTSYAFHGGHNNLSSLLVPNQYMVHNHEESLSINPLYHIYMAHDHEDSLLINPLNLKEDKILLSTIDSDYSPIPNLPAQDCALLHAYFNLHSHHHYGNLDNKKQLSHCLDAHSIS